ncbi:DUF2512 family protein [Paenibacillus larvae]|uniref:DUF2512 family protein n=1 Tax=Paenibacillus larvae subsp. larvae TaxID=147375 RepID=A0A6C0QNM7_9BACL|nr:DUF2512 family protein [Paenibacillus larvae]QHZ50329.1 hypothetical protein ERICV_01156 [Paenibacillus larvae subsp. larvae]
MLNKFLIKVLLNGIVVIPLLMWYTEATFVGAATAAVILSVIAYLIGDQIVLRYTNNTVATIVDAVVALFYLWLVARYANWSLSVGELLTVVIVLGVVEIGFHRFLGQTSVNKEAR